MHPTLERRIKQFHDQYDDPYAPYVAELGNLARDLLEAVFGDAAHFAMWELHEKLFGRPKPDRFMPWDEMHPENVARTFLSHSLAELHAYAHYGIVLREKEAGGLADPTCFAFFSGHNDLIDNAPREWSGLEPISETLKAAESRLTIDGLSPFSSVSPEGLASLAKISLKTIKNLLTPSSGSGLRAEPGGHIHVKQAMKWLETRTDFLPSVWHLADGDEDPTSALSSRDPAELSEVIFVPVAKDGTAFLPHLVRDGRYTIGPKGAEIQIEDYREALDRLTRMPRPSWRRPNEMSNWGIVVATSWLRKTLADLAIQEG